jgi:hypothetical protein
MYSQVKSTKVGKRLRPPLAFGRQCMSVSIWGSATRSTTDRVCYGLRCAYRAARGLVNGTVTVVSSVLSAFRGFVEE